MISKMDYWVIVYDPLPDYQLKRLQRVQNAYASFVTGKFSKIDDVINLGWLPMQQRPDWHLHRTVHKALYQDAWLVYLRLEKVSNTRITRSSNGVRSYTPMKKNTFQDGASKLFNSLLLNIRNKTNFFHFINEFF